MKRLVSALLAVFVVLSFCACGKNAQKDYSKLSADEKFDIAAGHVGKEYGGLLSEIGEAESSDHSARCGTAGEDYEYDYGTFIVLTYKEGGSEIVEEVEKN